MKRILIVYSIAVYSLVGGGIVQGSIVQDEDLPMIASDLETFANSLSNTTLSNKTELSNSIQEYLQSHGPDYFGSTVTVVSLPEQQALYSPYVYWNGTDALIQTDSLMDPSYDINQQAWLRVPIDTKEAVWSEPYFDAGGGNVWMMTRSYPILNTEGEVVAVATTDVHIRDITDTDTNTSAAGGGGGVLLYVGLFVPILLV